MKGHVLLDTEILFWGNRSLKNTFGPGRVAQLVRVLLSQYIHVVGSIPIQGTYKNQAMNI